MHERREKLDDTTYNAGGETLLDLHDHRLEQSLQFDYEIGAVTEVGAGEVMPWITLPNANIAYFVGGLWKIECEGIGAFPVRSGEAVFVAAGVRHRSAMVDEGVSQSRWAHFNVRLCGYIDLFSFFTVPPVFRGATAARLGEILAQLAQLPQSDAALPFLLNRKMLEFEMSAILIGQSTPKYHGELRWQQIQRVLPILQILNENPAAAHTRDSMAQAAHLSPSRFSAVFREAVGLAPIDYLVKLRMQRARQLLPDRAFSVAQIAAQVGYDDAFYFSRLFKAHYGFSPRAYRASLDAPQN